MSLIISDPFTILTYDPPSSPLSHLALKNKVEQTPLHKLQGAGIASRKSSPPKEKDSPSSGRPPGKTPSTRAKGECCF
ncbi:hypothetical protein CI109_105862 [Kwoniella shandongensis]|uniref:Uncharacterized protein n=1 Tax=Kwoniella shandongensis TaxID=1734106 RepID=A0A5M6BSX4_9TREE|nr:uncharacterized protein CI109_005703 [Kwoniella shandongensis]KAA5525956.1 hypothetical protein CI109_005703 [Kwoniella shandongensis]